MSGIVGAKVTGEDLSDALLEAALENTARAQGVDVNGGAGVVLSPETAAQASRAYAQAALAQVQAAVTLSGRSREGRRPA